MGTVQPFVSRAQPVEHRVPHVEVVDGLDEQGHPGELPGLTACYVISVIDYDDVHYYSV